MTKSTDYKNIKKIVSSILQKYSIDNLQLEIDIISAWNRYLNEREDGFSPAETRERIVKEFGVLGSLGISDEALKRAGMQQELMDILGLDVNEDGSEWRAVISFCLEKKAQGQTIQGFRDWMNRDPYNSPKKHQIALNPLLIKKTWLSAFESEKEKVREVQMDDNETPMSY